MRDTQSLRMHDGTPAARRWNDLLDLIDRLRVRVVDPLCASETMGGIMLTVKPSPPAATASSLPFYATGGIDIYSNLICTCTGGTIQWQGYDYTVADVTTGAPLYLTDNATNSVYVDLIDPFNPTNPPSILTATSMPAEPSLPARRYVHLADIVTLSGAISSTTYFWHGGDIEWPGQPWSFWA